MRTRIFQGERRVQVFALLLAALAGHGSAQAGELKSKYFGRWSVNDPTQKFSANARPYRVIDIAPCGNDFCGVSVEGGACGATLFRFLAIHADNELIGHGRWGAKKKRIIVSGPLSIELGDHLDPTGRSGNVPTFEANYHRIGDAACKADAPGA